MSTYVAAQHDRINVSLYRVTPLEDGKELVDYIGPTHRDRPRVEELLLQARAIGTATGSKEVSYTDGDDSLRWYANAFAAPRVVAGIHLAPAERDPAQAELARRCSAQSGIPAVGDAWVVSILTGYKLVQNRPLDHRDCRCGNGTTTYVEGTVERVTHYMDNSVEADVLDPDGKRHRVTLVAPHGDACF